MFGQTAAWQFTITATLFVLAFIVVRSGIHYRLRLMAFYTVTLPLVGWARLTAWLAHVRVWWLFRADDRRLVAESLPLIFARWSSESWAEWLGRLSNFRVTGANLLFAGTVLRNLAMRHARKFPVYGGTEWLRYDDYCGQVAAFRQNRWKDGKPPVAPSEYIPPWLT